MNARYETDSFVLRDTREMLRQILLLLNKWDETFEAIVEERTPPFCVEVVKPE